MTVAGHYISLVDSGDIGKVTRMFEDAIALSFVTNPMRQLTRHEVKRRFTICDRIFSTLRGDLKWSVPRIGDFLGTYLKCELDGVSYDPTTVRGSWSPDAVARVHDVPQDPDFVLVGHDGLPVAPLLLHALDGEPPSGDTGNEPLAGSAGAREE